MLRFILFKIKRKSDKKGGKIWVKKDLAMRYLFYKKNQCKRNFNSEKAFGGERIP